MFRVYCTYIDSKPFLRVEGTHLTKISTIQLLRNKKRNNKYE